MIRILNFFLDIQSSPTDTRIDDFKRGSKSNRSSFDGLNKQKFQVLWGNPLIPDFIAYLRRTQLQPMLSEID